MSQAAEDAFCIHASRSRHRRALPLTLAGAAALAAARRFATARAIACGCALAILLQPTVRSAQASAFALIENSGASIGTAYAGVAASAEDASTIYFNPAGMTFLPQRQVVLAGHLIRPSTKFVDRGSQPPAGQPLGNDGGDASGLAFIPNNFATWAVSDRLRLGVGINAPFGLKTDYEAGWIGRYHALKSEVRTVNINPSVAYRIGDTVSLGAGISIQRADATLTNAANLGTGDGRATVKAHDTNIGFNGGILVQVTPATRVGAAYRSSIGHTLDGHVSVTNAARTVVSAGPITADLKLPASFSLSSFTRLNDRWDVLLDASWTQWSSFQRLLIIRSDTQAIVQNQPQEWRDTWRWSAGANYRWSPELMLRFGVAYDQTPVGDTLRAARVPDGSRTWLAFGARYALSRAMSIDAGYAYLFVSDPSVSDLRGTAAGQAGNLVGSYSNNVNILSAQVNYAF